MATLDEYYQSEEAASMEVFPSRIDVCLPGTLSGFIPIPFPRIYSIKDRRLVIDWQDVLRYTVHLLLEASSHLSVSERQRLASLPTNIFFHPISGLLLHSQPSFGKFAFDCILLEHNSIEPLVLSPTWPSVFFDENGYPAFGEDDHELPDVIPPTTTTDNQQIPSGIARMDDPEELAGEKILHEFAPEGAQTHREYVPHQPRRQQPSSTKRRRHMRLKPAPVEFVTLNMPRL